jgi:hypothetical protein
MPITQPARLSCACPGGGRFIRSFAVVVVWQGGAMNWFFWPPGSFCARLRRENTGFLRGTMHHLAPI